MRCQSRWAMHGRRGGWPARCLARLCLQSAIELRHLVQGGHGAGRPQATPCKLRMLQGQPTSGPAQSDDTGISLLDSLLQPSAVLSFACSKPAAQAPLCRHCMPLLPARVAAGAVRTVLLSSNCSWRLRSSSSIAAAAAAAPSRAMGQKSLDAFFKRPASAQGAKAASTTAAAAAAGGGDAAQPAAEAVAGVPPQPPAAAAAGDGNAEDVHAAQAGEQQRMRAAANRNAALAKQVGLGGGLEALGLPALCAATHGHEFGPCVGACPRASAHTPAHRQAAPPPTNALIRCPGGDPGGAVGRAAAPGGPPH